MYVLETYELTHDQRIIVSEDQHYFDYLTEWDHDAFGVFTISSATNLRNLALDNFGINERLMQVMEWHEHSWNHDTTNKALGKAIERAGYDYKFLHLKGHSQGEWHYVVAYWKKELMGDASGTWGELESWYRDGTAVVSLQTKVVYTAPDGRTTEEWDGQETVWQVLFTDSYPLTKENAMEILGMENN
jgi:hypothetical protein